jgi:phage-related minor tail protein
MAGNIRGVTIEFRGDTTKLDKALRQVNNETKNIDKELRQVDKALKFNPTSVELWRQKQTLLTQKINETKDKLSLLKQQQAQMDASGVDKNSEEYRKLQREIIETESKLKTFEGQLKQVGNVNLRAMSEQFKDVGNKLTSAGQAMQGLSMAAAGVVASLGAISYKAGTNADDLNTLSKVYSINTQDLQKYSVAADLVDVSVEDIAKSHVKLEKSMYSANNGSKAQAEAFAKLGVSVTNADGSLRSSDAVWQDTISALGKMTNETERDAIAQQLMGKSAANLNPLIEDQGETYKNLTDTLKKYDLDFVDQETLDKANQFNDSLDTMKAIGSVALSTVGAQLAGYLAPALEKVVGWIGQLAGWLSSLSPQVLTVIGVVAAVVAGIAPVLLILGKLAFAVSSIMSLMSTLGVSIGALAGPVGIAIAIIAALVAIGVLLYKNWDKIKAKAAEIAAAIVAKWTALKTSVANIFNGIKTTISNTWNIIKHFIFSIIKNIVMNATSSFNSLKTTVSTIWNNIKTAITNPIQSARDKVKGIIDKIKGYFPLRLGKLLHFSLPKISIGSKSKSIMGKTISVPDFSISWASHARGGIFDRPTLLTDNNGGLHQVGEAGPEAILPLKPLWDKLDSLQGNGTTEININVYGAEGQSAREIAEEVKQMLITESKRRRLAWQ